MYRNPVPPPFKPKMQRQVCPQCRGQGKIMKTEVFEFGMKICPTCKGSGYIEYKQPPWRR